MTGAIAYFNGAWVPPTELSVPVDDLGFLLGATVSERLRTFGGRVFRMRAHLERLHQSLDLIGVNPTELPGDVGQVVQEVSQRNHALLQQGDDLGIVVFVTPGRQRAPSGSEPTLCVHAAALPFADWAQCYHSGVKLIVSEARQVPPNCWPPQLKCRSRMHYFLADAQARAVDPAARALLLDQRGMVAEASTANVLMGVGGRLISPRTDYILPGVSLSVLEELAERSAIPMEYRDIRPDELAAADEAMLSSTSPCLLPVVMLNGRAVGAGAAGPIFRRLLVAWSEAVGVDIAAQAAQFRGRGG